MFYSHHCLYRVIQLLLEEGFHDLRVATEERYLEFRRDYYETKKNARIQASEKKQRRYYNIDPALHVT